MTHVVYGCETRTVLDGKEVVIFFYSPYRWRIFDLEGNDITKSFGHATIGNSLDPKSQEWEDFHAAVDKGEISSKLKLKNG